MKEKKPINIQVGKGVRAARERAGLTQDQLGEILGLGTKNISDIERGVTGMTLSTLSNLCQHLSVSSDTILFGDDGLNDVSYISERLAHLPPEQFSLAKDFLDQVLIMFSRIGGIN